MNHDPDFITEMYTLWEEYQRLRTIGSKKLRKQAEQILKTLIERFKQQAVEIRKAFLEKIGVPAFDGSDASIENAPDDNWFHWMLNLPPHIPQQLVLAHLMLYVPVLQYHFNARDARVTRWIGSLWSFLPDDTRKSICNELDIPYPGTTPLFFYERSYAIQKNQATLNQIVDMYIGFFAYVCLPIFGGLACPPEWMNQNVAKARNYWEQLDLSDNKDELNKLLLQYEQVAKCWDDYCANKFSYNDFRHYMAINGIEW